MGSPGPSVDAPALSLPLGLTLTLPVRCFPKPVQKERLLFAHEIWALIKTTTGPQKSTTAARLAQSVEHETLNLRVVGSSPTLGVSIRFLSVPNGSQFTAGQQAWLKQTEDTPSQGFPNSVLEGHSPVEFLYNQLQKNFLEGSSHPGETLISWFRCVFIGVGAKLCRKWALQDHVWTPLL